MKPSHLRLVGGTGAPDAPLVYPHVVRTSDGTLIRFLSERGRESSRFGREAFEGTNPDEDVVLEGHAGRVDQEYR